MVLCCLSVIAPPAHPRDRPQAKSVFNNASSNASSSAGSSASSSASGNAKGNASCHRRPEGANGRQAQTQPTMPGLPATPTNLGVLMVRGFTRPPCALSQVSTSSHTGRTPGIVLASSATGAQPATL